MLKDQEAELRSALELLALSPQLLWDMLKSTSPQRKKAHERDKTKGMYHRAIEQAFDANRSEHAAVLVQALKATTYPNTTAARGQKEILRMILIPQICGRGKESVTSSHLPA